MRGSKEALLVCTIIWDKCEYFKSHYVNPSQETWLKWLRNQGGLDVSRRTLNRYFRRAENSIQISRIRRVKHDAKKGMVFLTTLYSLSFLGLMLLYQTGRITFDKLKEYLKNRSPFEARIRKKWKKGVGPGDPGFFKDFTSLGNLLKKPG